MEATPAPCSRGFAITGWATTTYAVNTAWQTRDAQKMYDAFSITSAPYDGSGGFPFFLSDAMTLLQCPHWHRWSNSSLQLEKNPQESNLPWVYI